VKALEHHHELRSAIRSADYRAGIWLAWLLVILGGLYAGAGIFSSIGAGSKSLLYGLILTIMVAGFVVGSGLLLIRKAKMGLWGLYLLSAWFVLIFLSDLVNAIATRSVTGPPNAMIEVSFLLIWFSVVGYFVSRRRLFTRLWGGARSAVAGG
jgi:hypothetical protein